MPPANLAFCPEFLRCVLFTSTDFALFRLVVLIFGKEYLTSSSAFVEEELACFLTVSIFALSFLATSFFAISFFANSFLGYSLTYEDGS